jgi:hypothetical protein
MEKDDFMGDGVFGGIIFVFLKKQNLIQLYFDEMNVVLLWKGGDSSLEYSSCTTIVRSWEGVGWRWGRDGSEKEKKKSCGS